MYNSRNLSFKDTTTTGNILNILNLIGRKNKLFVDDIDDKKKELKKIISSSCFLVLGGAGSIGSAVSKEIFKRNPKKLHIVDISENNMVELVRDIRNSFGYIDGDFQTFALDIGSLEYDAFIKNDGKYDFVLNLSALKHVRSEKDVFTLMRMINVNIFNTIKTIKHSIKNNTKKYFCVSTDKATNPVNMMGASKSIMEKFINQKSKNINVSMARFANVAFSDGSLLHSFDKRLEKNQAIVAPQDIKRYFITPQESGELCLMSCIFGENRDIFFPKLNEDLHLISFFDIAIKYLENKGYEPYLCDNEEKARQLAKTLPTLSKKSRWPCLSTFSDTTGEKDFEEFFTDDEVLDMDRFNSVGIIKNEALFDDKLLQNFKLSIKELQKKQIYSKKEIVDIFLEILPNFTHKETGKYLDSKM